MLKEDDCPWKSLLAYQQSDMKRSIIKKLRQQALKECVTETNFKVQVSLPFTKYPNMTAFFKKLVKKDFRKSGIEIEGYLYDEETSLFPSSLRKELHYLFPLHQEMLAFKDNNNKEFMYLYVIAGNKPSPLTGGIEKKRLMCFQKNYNYEIFSLLSKLFILAGKDKTRVRESKDNFKKQVRNLKITQIKNIIDVGDGVISQPTEKFLRSNLEELKQYLLKSLEEIKQENEDKFNAFLNTLSL